MTHLFLRNLVNDSDFLKHTIEFEKVSSVVKKISLILVGLKPESLTF